MWNADKWGILVFELWTKWTEESCNVRVLPVPLKFDMGQIQLRFRQTGFLQISENRLPCPAVELDPCPCLPLLGIGPFGDCSRAGCLLGGKFWSGSYGGKKLWLQSPIGPNSSGKNRGQLDCCLCQQLIWMLFGVERQHLKLHREFNPSWNP